MSPQREASVSTHTNVERRKGRPFFFDVWPRRREFVWMGAAALLALLYAAGVAEQEGRDATAGIVAQADARARAHVSERLAMHYEALAAERTGQLAKLMDGRGRLVWQDPHTLNWMGTFCETHVLESGD